MKRLAFVVVLLLSALPVSAVAAPPAQGWAFPVIQGYGGIHVWKQAIDRPDPAATYKTLFVIHQGDPKSSQVNFGLQQVARALNEFGAAGVPSDHLKLEAVITGPATPLVLDGPVFMARYHHANPDLDLIARLQHAGVHIMVCGNALYGFGFTPGDLNPDIQIALSALTTTIIAQSRGYAIVQM
ncbi:DsrE family protein [Metallibacterium scheffleri]|uniref:DsrE family protein n=1 Tax=Metallibacterium scheffleri TaxID=993689 RepID=UPI0023F02AAA|nr:DsrE family protein [Metallibacterium scheffleri]